MNWKESLGFIRDPNEDSATSTKRRTEFYIGKNWNLWRIESNKMMSDAVR